MKITAIAAWFGSKRTLAPRIVQELGPHKYYFEGCCGSMAILLAKEPSHHEVVCDLHGDLINLACVLQNESQAVELFNRLQRTMYSEDLFAVSRRIIEIQGDTLDHTNDAAYKLERAYHYFICSWMGRNGVSGTARYNYQIATRWTAGGGSGPLRFRNAVDSIPTWCDRLRNVLILRKDLFDVLANIEDASHTAIYVDPPYLWDTMSGSSRYLHDFENADHERLAKELRRFCHARIVVSYYDSPRLAELYPGWTKIDCSRQKHLAVQNKRGMGRTEAPEVLLVNGESYRENGKSNGELF